jgi:osmotically-inducible protein OsmY
MASRARWLVTTVATGAVVRYFMDPARGRSRRDQVAGAVRRRTERLQGKASYVGDRARGLAHEAKGHDLPPADDRTLVDKVRSEVLGREEFRSATVNVDAVDGVVSLRGQLDSADQIGELEQAVRKVTGVREVRNLVHTPGTPPPNL